MNSANPIGDSPQTSIGSSPFNSGFNKPFTAILSQSVAHKASASFVRSPLFGGPNGVGTASSMPCCPTLRGFAMAQWDFVPRLHQRSGWHPSDELVNEKAGLSRARPFKP